MNAFPPFVTGLTLLFWGWETKLLWPAIIGAVLLELPHVVRWRWDFAAADMRRVWDVSALLFLGAAAIAYSTTDLITGGSKYMPWLPIVFFPFSLAVAYAEQDTVYWSTFFWLFRFKRRIGMFTQPLGRYWPYWYVVICFMAVSIANVRDLRFYSGLAVIGAVLLWSCRNRSVPIAAWGALVIVAGAAGFFGHHGLTYLQRVVESQAGRFFAEFIPVDADFTRARTYLGSVGRLKLSGRVLLRVETPPNQAPPDYLREASFDEYTLSGRRVVWRVERSDFDPVDPTDIAGTWLLTSAPGKVDRVYIAKNLPGETGILPLPSGPVRIADLPATEVQTNQWGSVRAREAQAFIRYEVAYRNRSTLDKPPAELDRSIPAIERPALKAIAAELKLAGLPPEEILFRVKEYFYKEFRYSRYLGGWRFDPGGRQTPLRQFLLEDKAGHCEYFATAATLLLREAGIPARYAIGYAMPTEEGQGNMYLVRARHGHAWTLAYVNGEWQDFDTTPPSWVAEEEEQRAWFQPLTDWLSGVSYRWNRLRYYGESGTIARIALWVVPVLVGWLSWRLFRRRRSRRNRPTDDALLLRWNGMDSEFYAIERHLAGAGYPRHVGETVQQWLRRLESSPLAIAPLRDLASLHYAYRFDPQGLDAPRRETLRERVAEWLRNSRLLAGDSRKDGR